METKVATKREPAVARRQASDFTDQLIEPFTQLRNEVDRLFEGFPFRIPQLAMPRFVRAPALEMTETDKAYKVTAELAGMEPENVDVTFDDGVLRIAGGERAGIPLVRAQLRDIRASHRTAVRRGSREGRSEVQERRADRHGREEQRREAQGSPDQD